VERILEIPEDITSYGLDVVKELRSSTQNCVDQHVVAFGVLSVLET
jgi:hypothetical protein